MKACRGGSHFYQENAVLKKVAGREKMKIGFDSRRIGFAATFVVLTLVVTMI